VPEGRCGTVVRVDSRYRHRRVGAAVARPPLPQIRTCPIKASGSSGYGFPIPHRYALKFRGHGDRVQSPGHVSLQRFRSPALPSLHRVPTVTVPRLRRYYGALRFPANRHGGFPCRSPAVTTGRVCFRLSLQARRRPGARSIRVRPPPRRISGGVAGRPKFLGNPRVPMPCSRTPAGPQSPGHAVIRTRPPACQHRRLPAG